MKVDLLIAFAAGDRVRVRTGEPGHHCRTPHFLRGREGVVEEAVGIFRDPERLAYHKPGLPKKALYSVRFRQADLWPDYRGHPGDTLAADIYEHWLEPAVPKSGAKE